MYRRKLYVVTVPELIPCKVGVAVDVAKRLVSIQTCNWQEVGLYATFSCGNALGMERAILRYYRDHVIRGEWLDLSAAVVVRYVYKLFRAGKYGSRDGGNMPDPP